MSSGTSVNDALTGYAAGRLTAEQLVGVVAAAYYGEPGAGSRERLQPLMQIIERAHPCFGFLHPTRRSDPKSLQRISLTTNLSNSSSPIPAPAITSQVRRPAGGSVRAWGCHVPMGAAGFMLGRRFCSISLRSARSSAALA